MGAFNSTIRWRPTFTPPPATTQDPTVANGGGTSSINDTTSSSEAPTDRTAVLTSTSSSTHSTIMGRSAPPLYEAALVGEWTNLLHRCSTHPSEASYTDKRKNIPLHLACRRQPPPEVVSALVRAYPDGASKKTLDGLTALHFACYCGAEAEVVKLLLDRLVPPQQPTTTGGSAGGAPPSHNDTAIKRQRSHNSLRPRHTIPELFDRRRRTPLHCACAGFRTPHRLSVIRLLLQADPTTVTLPDERGRTPLSLTIDDYAEEIEDALSEGVTSLEARNMCLKEKGELNECWDTVNLLLRAAYRGTIADFGRTHAMGNEIDVDGTFHLTHAACGVLDCPSSFVRLVLKVKPESVKEKDGDFNLPLHVAARSVMGISTTLSARSYRVLSSCSSGNLKGAAGGGGGSGVSVYNADFGRSRSLSMIPMSSSRSNARRTTSRSFTSGSGSGSSSRRYKPLYSYTVIEDLIALYPEAASVPDETGKLPLLLAIESGKPWDTAVGPILRAYPKALFESSDEEHEEDNDHDDVDEEDEVQQDGGVGSGEGQEVAYAVQTSILAALSNPSIEVRNETIKTLGELCREYWNHPDGFIADIVARAGSGGGSDNRGRGNPQSSQRLPQDNPPPPQASSTIPTADEEKSSDIQTSLLHALSEILDHVPTQKIYNLNDTVNMCLDVGITHMIQSDNEIVREAASSVVGSSVNLLGTDCAVQVLEGVILKGKKHWRRSDDKETDGEDEEASDDGSSKTREAGTEQVVSEEEGADEAVPQLFPNTVESRHGRALGCYRILSSPTVGPTLPTPLLQQTTSFIKDLLKDDEAKVVRKAASLAVGSVLGRSTDTTATLRDLRGSILKCMRATEDPGVHRQLGRGLSVAAFWKEKMFLCKAGMPILDGALMLSLSGGGGSSSSLSGGGGDGGDETMSGEDGSGLSVQHVFHNFLYLALRVKDGEEGMNEYMKLSEGENGRIMMSLVTKTLVKIDHVEDPTTTR